MQTTAAAGTIVLSAYSDVAKLEQEIARLLKCQEHRKPACLYSEGFWNFKNTILRWIMLNYDHEETNNARCHLSQKLLACAETSANVPGVVTVQLAWEDNFQSNDNVEAETSKRQRRMD